jgi:membrane-bound lytic murein transglycosylase B
MPSIPYIWTKYIGINLFEKVIINSPSLTPPLLQRGAGGIFCMVIRENPHYKTRSTIAMAKTRVTVISRRFLSVVFIALSFVLALPHSSSANDFADWLMDLRTEARLRGISDRTLDSALAGIKPIPRIIELDRNQPEFKKDFKDYLKTRVSRKRIKQGRKMLKKHSSILNQIEKKYGVPPQFLVE